MGLIKLISPIKPTIPMNIRLALSLFICLLSFSPAGAQDTLTVRIKGMRCDECAHKVMVAVRALPGIESLRSNTERRTTTIVYNPALTCRDSIEGRLAATGRFKASPYSPNDTILRGIGLRMDDMHCQKCADRIMGRLQTMTGIDSMSPHLDKQYMFIRYDANRTCRDSINAVLVGLGFTPVNYYTSPKVSFAYFNIPAEQATQDAIDELLIATDAVDDVNVNARRGSMAVTYFNDEITADQLLETIRNAGIDAQVPPPHECKE